MRDARIAVELIVCQVAVTQQMLRDRAPFLGELDLLTAVLGREHALAQGVERCLELFLGGRRLRRLGIAQVLGDRDTRDAPFDHGRGCLLDAGDIARDIHARHARGAALVADRHVAAALGIVDHLAARHRQQLAHGRQAHGHADGINVEVLLGTGNHLPMAVDLADGHAGHAVGALGFDHGVGQVERHTAARDLGRMHAVTAHARCGIHQGDHIAARLQQLERHDEPHIARAHHEHALARLDAMEIHHGLCGTGPDHAGQCPALEVEGVLGRARGHEHRISLHMTHGITHAHDDLAALVQADDRGVEHHVDACGIGLGQKLLADPEAAHLRPVLLGPEELVDLLEELTARSRVLVEDHHVKPAAGGLDRGGKSARAGTDDHQIMTFHPTHPPSHERGSRVLRPPDGRHVGRRARAARRRLACARPCRRPAASCKCARWACRLRP